MSKIRKYFGINFEQEKHGIIKTVMNFFFPSLREAFGLTVIKAKRNGAPVLTSNKINLPKIKDDYTFIFKILMKNGEIQYLAGKQSTHNF